MEKLAIQNRIYESNLFSTIYIYNDLFNYMKLFEKFCNYMLHSKGDVLKVSRTYSDYQ